MQKKNVKKRILRIILGYGIWILLWIGLSMIESEYGVGGFFYLSITGLPLSIVGWDIMPNGGILSLVSLGILGMIQWVIVAIIFSVRFDKKSKY